MNESQQPKQPEKDTSAQFGFLLVVLGLGLIAGILKLIGLV